MLPMTFRWNARVARSVTLLILISFPSVHKIRGKPQGLRPRGLPRNHAVRGLVAVRVEFTFHECAGQISREDEVFLPANCDEVLDEAVVHVTHVNAVGVRVTEVRADSVV